MILASFVALHLVEALVDKIFPCCMGFVASARPADAFPVESGDALNEFATLISDTRLGAL